MNAPTQAHMAFEDEWEQLELLTEDELQAELDALFDKPVKHHSQSAGQRQVDRLCRSVANGERMRAIRALDRPREPNLYQTLWQAQRRAS